VNGVPTVEQFRDRFVSNLRGHRGVELSFAAPNDCYQALALTVREHLTEQWLDSLQAQLEARARFVFYLSAEYLLGRQLDNALLNTGLHEVAHEALAGLGLSLDVLREVEEEPGLGNGGLGRLAACYLDSLATLGVAAVGYGIRYDYGIFRQAFADGWQVEQPDDWLRLGSPWEFPHPELAVSVGFGGTVDDAGDGRRRWRPETMVAGEPHNFMVPGFRSGTVNVLRLWRARSMHAFDLEIFNDGDYVRAVHDKVMSENISKVLYPDDSTSQGKELRLRQQYFFVACSLADLIANLGRVTPIERIAERAVIQMNDTHPVIAVPELMRIFVDDHGWDWDRAWATTRALCNYTCHTLLPEALETWPVDLLGRLLPRHLEIIGDIDRRFQDELRRRYPGDDERVRRMAIIADGRVRMAHLATVGSTMVNGVAALHSELLRNRTLSDFAELWPERFGNVTNGVTPRRFVRLANPSMARLISEAIGDAWVGDLERLRALEPHADDASFREAWRLVKRANRERAAGHLHDRTGAPIDPAAMADVMVKRLHLYKRQLLKVLSVIAAYQRIKDDPAADVVPRTVVFGAKAAPGYAMAKQVIRLINGVAAVVNTDPDVAGRLVVAYPANYNVTMAEWLIPGADLSEQISLAGKEASGTGNMKFALNGALTIGTLDGANVEIRDLVGPEHFFLFGLTVDEVQARKAAGYAPRAVYEAEPAVRRAVDAIAAGTFSHGDPSVLRPLVDDLLGTDEFLVLADFAAYEACSATVDAAWLDADDWSRRSILNVARCGFFSSDRSVRDYLDRIWHADPVPARA
jgi:starch phosphorylase